MTEQELKEIKKAWARGEAVQYFNGVVWMTWQDDRALDVSASFSWRVKPKNIYINGYEVPAPREELEEGQEYYVPSLFGEKLFSLNINGGDYYDERWLELGLCHATKEAAIAHARALLSFTEQKK